jgi:hypothetical protein
LSTLTTRPLRRLRIGLMRSNPLKRMHGFK